MVTDTGARLLPWWSFLTSFYISFFGPISELPPKGTIPTGHLEGVSDEYSSENGGD